MIDKKIGIIGCGNMGEALLAGLSKAVSKSADLMVSEADSARKDYIRGKYKIILEDDNNAVVKFADVIILAIKPKDFDSILSKEACCGVSKDKLLISIAAGITTKYIEEKIGKDIPVIRVMPNMPAKIGAGISAIAPGMNAAKKDLDIAKEIFRTIGEVVEVDEKMMDAVTAVSGSGPAYFFYLIEAMIESAVSLGIKPDEAKKLVLKTASGSVKLIESLKEEPKNLISKVASKGGTTEAALKIFEKRRFKEIVKEAIKAASRRSKVIARR